MKCLKCNMLENSNFKLGERIYIKGLEINGKIQAIRFDDLGYRYQVDYLFTGEKRQYYFCPEELKKL